MARGQPLLGPDGAAGAGDMTLPRLALELPSPTASPGQPEPLPVCEVGGSLPVTLRLDAQAAAGVSQVTLRLVLRCHGSGTPEESVAHETTLQVPALAAGAACSVVASVQVPLAGPVSYCGEHVKLDWSVRVIDSGGSCVMAPIRVNAARSGAPGSR